MPGKRYSLDLKESVIAAWKKYNYGYGTLAEMFSLNKKTVRYWIKTYILKGSVKTPKVSGNLILFLTCDLSTPKIFFEIRSTSQDLRHHGPQDRTGSKEASVHDSEVNLLQSKKWNHV